MTPKLGREQGRREQPHAGCHKLTLPCAWGWAKGYPPPDTRLPTPPACSLGCPAPPPQRAFCVMEKEAVGTGPGPWHGGPCQPPCFFFGLMRCLMCLSNFSCPASFSHHILSVTLELSHKATNRARHQVEPAHLPEDATWATGVLMCVFTLMYSRNDVTLSRVHQQR